MVHVIRRFGGRDLAKRLSTVSEFQQALTNDKILTNSLNARIAALDADLEAQARGRYKPNSGN